MMQIYARVKSYALRTGPYLYDMRFLIAGFGITYYGISKIASAGAKSKFLILRSKLFSFLFFLNKYFRIIYTVRYNIRQ